MSNGCPSHPGDTSKVFFILCKRNGTTERKKVAVLWDKGGVALVPLLCERPHLPPEGPITLHSVCLQVPFLYTFTSRTMNSDLTSVYTSRI